MAEAMATARGFHRPRASGIGEAVATGLIWMAAFLVLAGMTWIIGSIAWSGTGYLSWEFLVAAPKNAGLSGGIGPILVSTLILLAIALVAAVPVGLATAMLLAEFTRQGGTFGRMVRMSLDILAGVPSIVFGLFGNAFFSLYLGLGFSLLSGGLTLACMVLPLLIRATEEGFRSVPDEYRQAAAALGISKPATIWHLLLPAATPGLIVGLVLGIGRALAETAALIFTSGYVDRMPESLLDSGRTLSLHIFDLAMNVPGGDGNAYASTLILISLILAINALATWIATRWLHRRILLA
jgi:phosphate transport system permease protein